jgi:hypothetical protein
MKKVLTVLGITILFSFQAGNKVTIESTVVNEMQRILIHSITLLDNGSYRNNYDSVKSCIQELNAVYAYLEQVKKQADSTNKKEPIKP